MDAIIKHGYDDPSPYLNGPPRLKIGTDGLDTLVLPYAAPTRGAFADGATAPAPWSSFRIADIDQEQDGDEWLLTLNCEGLAAERRRRGFPRIVENAADWDTAEDGYITTNANRFQAGQISGAYGGTCVCLSASSSLLRTGIYEWNARFVGIISAKPRTRSISVAGRTVSGDAVTVNLPGGWTTPRKGEAQLPQVTVTDTYITSSPPPTNLLPGPAVPPNAPAVKNIPLSGSNLTYHWPNGWMLASITGEQLPGSSLWKNTWTYQWQLPVTW
jgi:hypothetical protein